MYRLAITKLDIFDDLDEVKIGVAYLKDGKKIDFFPGEMCYEIHSPFLGAMKRHEKRALVFLLYGTVYFFWFSASNEELDAVEVEYVTIPGWKSDTTSIRKFEDLPESARFYVKKVEEVVGIPGAVFCFDLLS